MTSSRRSASSAPARKSHSGYTRRIDETFAQLGRYPHTHVDVSCAMPVVVGAHLIAEANHRALAMDLRDIAAEMLGDRGSELLPIVCTDLWYLNNDDLRSQPTISVGPPGLNALTAFLADKLPTAFAIDDRIAIQYDATVPDFACAVWGVDTPATAEAIAVFVDRHLPSVLERFTDA